MKPTIILKTVTFKSIHFFKQRGYIQCVIFVTSYSKQILQWLPDLNLHSSSHHCANITDGWDLQFTYEQVNMAGDRMAHL